MKNNYYQSIFNQMAEASKELGQYTANNIDYPGIAQRMRDISGADYCFINVYGKNGEGSTTVAASGIEKNIAKSVSLLGFNIVGKSWDYDPANEEKIRQNKITLFPSLSDLVGNILPGSILSMIETMFNLGEAVVVRTTKDELSIGDITLLFKRNKHLQNRMLVEAFADITASTISRIAAEQHLDQTRLTYESMVNSLTEAIYILDEKGLFIEVNKGASIMYGYSHEELIGQSPMTVAAPGMNDVNAVIRKMVQVSKSGNPARFEFWAKRKNGEIFPKDVILNKGQYFGKDVVIAVARDITEIKKTENTQKIILEISQLSFTHNSLNSFLAAIHQKVNKIIRSENFYVALYQPDSNTYTFPYHKDEIDDLALDTPLDLDGGFTDYVRKSGKVLLRRGISAADTDTTKPLTGIGDVPSVWLGLPLKIAPNDEVIGVMAVQDYHNFEAYNEVEIVILELIANKIGVYIERVKNYEDLKKAKEKAEESDRLKSAILMNMSHEIRTPMNGILGFIDLLENPDIDEQSRKTYLDVVNKSGQRLLNTINDIIEVSRIETGELNIKIEEVNVEEVMQFQYDFFRPQAVKKNLNFQRIEKVTGNAALIKTDKHKLDGILNNLIKNAIKFTSHGVIEIGNKIENNHIEFWVSDSGRGIPADRLEVIFDQFVQAELAITRAHEGSGLGLSIVKAYVEALGGKILVQSEEAKGSTFRFSLPYISSKKLSPPDFKANDNHKSIPKGLTILLAEDDEVSYELLKFILTKQGFNLIRTTSGEDTVKALQSNPSVALILMDIKMPGMDGLEASKRIRQFNNTIPIIAQTAHAFIGEKEKAIQAGCNDYIPKPINKGKLMDMMKKYLEKPELANPPAATA